ncbi:MAG: hypothetical protein AAF740_03240 [Bacteroidota bacterium]
MLELYQAAVSPTNFIYSLMLLMALLYWVTVFVGVLDIDSLDFDVDIDIDADFDVDVDADVDADTGASTSGGSFWLSVLSFFNLGKVPFMIFFSFLALSLWVGSILFNYYLAQGQPWFWAAGWVIPNLLIALFITKALTQVVAPVFADEVNEFATHEDVVGKLGVASLPLDDYSVGEIRVATKAGAPLCLRAQAAQGREISKGDNVLVIFYDAEQKFYLVEPHLE